MTLPPASSHESVTGILKSIVRGRGFTKMGYEGTSNRSPMPLIHGPDCADSCRFSHSRHFQTCSASPAHPALLDWALLTFLSEQEERGARSGTPHSRSGLANDQKIIFAASCVALALDAEVICPKVASPYVPSGAPNCVWLKALELAIPI